MYSLCIYNIAHINIETSEVRVGLAHRDSRSIGSRNYKISVNLYLPAQVLTYFVGNELQI